MKAMILANDTMNGLHPTLPLGTTTSLVYEPVSRPKSPLLQGDGPADKQPFTTTVKYLQPGISCRPLHERLEFGMAIQEGLVLDTFDSNGIKFTMAANWSNKVSFDDPGEGRLVGHFNATLNGPTGEQRYPFPTAVKRYTEGSCAVETQVFRFGCGPGKKDVDTVPWGPLGNRTDCSAGVWILNTHECATRETPSPSSRRR